MQSIKFNAGLIFLVFGIIFLGISSGAPPTADSGEEFVEAAEGGDGGPLEQEIEQTDDEIYGENSFDDFRKQNPGNTGDVEDFVSNERPHPGDDLIQDGPGNQNQGQDEEGEGEQYSVEDFDLKDEEDEGEADGEPWDPDHPRPLGSLEEGEFENYEDERDEERDEESDAYDDEDDHENWYGPEDDSHESYYDGDEDQEAGDEGNNSEYV